MQLFQSLSHAVGHSGLFYESHLARFVAGQYPRAQLQAEPQARWETLSGKRSPEQTSTPNTKAHTDTQTSNTSSQHATGSHHNTAQPGPVISPEAALTIRQQLDALAMQTLQWHGEAWPQADMQWTITRNEEETASEAPAQWASTLTLTLPKLGTIHAHLILAGDAISIRLNAPHAEGPLKAQALALQQHMQAAGLALHRLEIGTTASAEAEQTTAPKHEHTK